jgi:ribonuclease BN (tRNA processing enzyme)
MDLKFIGNGSAFNTEEGNNSAFYINAQNQMLLIDCGETVFATLKQKNCL